MYLSVFVLLSSFLTSGTTTLFTATHKFFDNMTREDIIEWANTCMEFVYEDLGYKKNQILHSI